MYIYTSPQGQAYTALPGVWNNRSPYTWARAQADGWTREEATVQQYVKGDPGERGPKGDTGPQGPKGDTGDAGKSAYQTWLDLGNGGTEEDFLAALDVVGVPDAPADGTAYARRDGGWVSLAEGTLGGAVEVVYAVLPYVTFRAVQTFRDIRQVMVQAFEHRAMLSAGESLNVGSVDAGSWLVVLLPSGSGLAAEVVDALGSRPFDVDAGAEGSGVRSAAATYGGASYDMYVEFVPEAADIAIRLAVN